MRMNNSRTPPCSAYTQQASLSQRACKLNRQKGVVLLHCQQGKSLGQSHAEPCTCFVSQSRYFTYSHLNRFGNTPTPTSIAQLLLLKYCSVSPVMHYPVQPIRVQRHLLLLQEEHYGVRRYCSFQLAQN